MGVLWHNKAWADYCYWQTQDKKTIKRINALIQDIQRNGYYGTGKPEPLKENFSGWWSRRIDDANRIIYKICGEDVVIASCKGPCNN